MKLISAIIVITSYSIHYTKLYERTSRKVLFTQAGLRLVEQARRVLAEARVITSYSIHYTKLYDDCPRRIK